MQSAGVQERGIKKLLSDLGRIFQTLSNWNCWKTAPDADVLKFAMYLCTMRARLEPFDHTQLNVWANNDVTHFMMEVRASVRHTWPFVC